LQVDVFSDMVCPWCRIGKKNLSDALDEIKNRLGVDIAVNFRAFQLDPSVPPEGVPFMHHMKRMGSPERVRSLLQRVTEIGESIGLKFRYDLVTVMPNTLLAHRVGALLSPCRRAEWVDAVMTAYFEEGHDIGHLQVLLQLAERLGLDGGNIAQRLAAGDGLIDIEHDYDEAVRMGITGAPFFVINNETIISGAYPASGFVEVFEKIIMAGT
jgi:predicted DsbA family dithiol-disulfide isomerase